MDAGGWTLVMDAVDVRWWMDAEYLHLTLFPKMQSHLALLLPVFFFPRKRI